MPPTEREGWWRFALSECFLFISCYLLGRYAISLACLSGYLRAGRLKIARKCFQTVLFTGVFTET